VLNKEKNTLREGIGVHRTIMLKERTFTLSYIVTVMSTIDSSATFLFHQFDSAFSQRVFISYKCLYFRQLYIQTEIMNHSTLIRYIFSSLTTIIILTTLFVRLPSGIFTPHMHTYCLSWLSMIHQCVHYSQISSIVWTHQGSGFLKYLQWITVRKLSNVQIIRLDDNCLIIDENQYFFNQSTDRFIQVYILSSTTNFTHQSTCSTKIKQMIKINSNQIYFTRRSSFATDFYEQLDSLSKINNDFTYQRNTVTIHNLETVHLYISTLNWTVQYEEDFVQTDLDECEKKLRYLFSLLKLNSEHELIEYDSHRFLADAIWWDQSQVAETIINKSIPTRLPYVNDFYYLHGQLSFIQYLQQNRQCFRHGVFTQLQSETKSNRTSTDIPDRCSMKPFDCAFSDLYSFADREEIYEQLDKKRDFNDKPLKCGFIVPSVFDQIRKRYARNQTCKTILFTSISNCYDPLPEIQGQISPSFCLVALLDTITVDAYKKFYANRTIPQWDLIDLGPNVTPFSIGAKTAETLKIIGEHLFPLAQWIIWLDGKGRMNDIDKYLSQVIAPFISAPHPDRNRTSASEIAPTIERFSYREKPFSFRMNLSLADIKLQENEYKRDGFYKRSDELGLKMYDIAVFLYRNNHPCISRFLCGWHNEVNYYSYRGQLSVYYSAVRLNLTAHLGVLSKEFYSTVNHHAVC